MVQGQKSITSILGSQQGTPDLEKIPWVTLSLILYVSLYNGTFWLINLYHIPIFRGTL